MSPTQVSPPRAPTESELRRNLKVLKKAVLLQPLDLDARLRVARTYRLLQQPQKALLHYRSVMRYLAAAGHPLLAIHVAQELLQVDPSHEETLLFLARLYARTPGANPGGKVAVAVAEPGPDAVSSGVLGEWPRTVTGVWRAIRPSASGTLMKVMGNDPRNAGDATAVPPMLSLPAQDHASRMAQPPQWGETVAVTDREPTDAATLELNEQDVLAASVWDEHDTLPPGPAMAGVMELEDEDVDDSFLIQSSGDHAILEPEEVGAITTDELRRSQLALGDALAAADQGMVDDSAESPVPPLPELPDLVPQGAALPEVALLAGLSTLQRQQLTAALVRRTTAPGDFIWKEGDDAFFVLLMARGEAETFKGPVDSKVQLARLGPGDVAGLFALVGDRRRQASVVATTAVTWFELHRSVLEQLARENREVAAGLRQLFRDRVIEAALATLPVFKHLDLMARRSVALSFKDKRYGAGDELFYEGSEVSGLWVVLGGAVEVGSENAEGEFVASTLLAPGQFVVALGGQDAHTEFGAQAKGVTLTASINHKGLMQLMAQHPALQELALAGQQAGVLLSPHVLCGSAQLPVDFSPGFLAGL